MAALSFVLTALLLSVMHRGVDSAQLTITPPSLTLSGNNSVGTVKFTCAHAGSVPPNNLLILALGRTSSTGQITKLASAVLTVDGGNVIKETSLTGVTVEGSLSQQSISITLTEATCKTDEAIYICAEAVLGGTGANPVVNTEDSANFTVVVSPGEVIMTTEPFLPSYLVNETLVMRCNGLVGSNDPGVSIQWVWQFKDRQGFSYNEYQGSEDIMTEGIFQDPINRCQNRQLSTLTTVLALEDSGREYRCFVRRNNLPAEPDSLHSASYTISGVYAASMHSSTQTSTETQPTTTYLEDTGDSHSVSGAAIAGGVVAGGVVIVIIVIVVFVLRRKMAASNAKSDRPHSRIEDTKTSSASLQASSINHVAHEGTGTVNSTGGYTHTGVNKTGSNLQTSGDYVNLKSTGRKRHIHTPHPNVRATLNPSANPFVHAATVTANSSGDYGVSQVYVNSKAGESVDGIISSQESDSRSAEVRDLTGDSDTRNTYESLQDGQGAYAHTYSSLTSDVSLHTTISEGDARSVDGQAVHSEDNSTRNIYESLQIEHEPDAQTYRSLNPYTA